MRALPLLVVLIGACSRDTPAPRPRAATPIADAASAAAAAADACAIALRPATLPTSKGRLVAIGDVHGDAGAARRALRAAGAIDDRDAWIGGDLTIVQLGDLLDRGDDEQEIVDLFERLERDASAAGGAFHWLLGNHELMNAAGDFRYVTPGGHRDFADAPGVDPARVPEAPAEVRARAAAFLPGGAYARILAGQDIGLVIGDSAFSHAGFLPAWTADLAATNRAARCWLDGKGPPPAAADDPDGPVWTRAWGGEAADCAHLREVLAALGVARMVVAHTPQLQGITSLCDGQLWRIDTGMAAYYGGPIQVLEIGASGPTVLSAP